MDLTHEMLVIVQRVLLAAVCMCGWNHPTTRRLEKIEAYLIERYTRE